jgi:polyisoprenoid-binding protein YceI
MRAFALLILIIFSFPAFAHQPADDDGRICAPFRGGIVDPAVVKSMLQASKEGRLYRIQQKTSDVGFCVDSTLGRIEARFKGIEGGLALRREVWGDESQMLVMVDANSLEMDENFLKNILKSEYFLDTYTYSKILFVSTELNWLDQEKAILKGMLTMHGVTRPVHFEVTMTLVPNKDPQSVANIIVTAKTFIKRTDFNMDNLTILVDDMVELCMRIEASLFKRRSTPDG